MVQSSWNASSITRFPDWKTKLKNLKNDIRSWAKVDQEKRTLVKENLVHSLLEWDEKAENGELVAEDKEKNEGILFDLSKLDQKENIDLRQKKDLDGSQKGTRT